MPLLRVVHRFHRVQHGAAARRIAARSRPAPARPGEAGTAVAGAGIDEVPADARDPSRCPAHVLDVGADLLGDVRDLVHEADLGREHRVRRVLGQFRRTHVHHHEAVVVAVERRIQALELVRRARAVGADHDPVRAHAVPDRRASLRNSGFETTSNGTSAPRACSSAAMAARTFVRGADRHRGLVDHHRRPLQIAADGLRHRQHVLQVGAAVLVRRRADRDEHHFAVGDAHRRVGGEAQPAFGMVGF